MQQKCKEEALPFPDRHAKTRHGLIVMQRQTVSRGQKIQWRSGGSSDSVPSEHETHLKRFKHCIKAFQHFWCASEMHWKRISWISWIKVKVGIIDAFLMRIWNASRCASFEKFKCALRMHIGCVSNTHQPCIYVFTSLKRTRSAFEVHIFRRHDYI